MSVVKRLRKESDFEVFHHMNKLRRSMTDLLLRDFGYDRDKADSYLQKICGGKEYNVLTDSEKTRFDKAKKRRESFTVWFIRDE